MPTTTLPRRKNHCPGDRLSQGVSERSGDAPVPLSADSSNQRSSRRLNPIPMAGLGAVPPAFRECGRCTQLSSKMKVYGYTINNKTYEGTVAITPDDFEDDNLGVYIPRAVSGNGVLRPAQPDKLVFTRLA